MAEETTASVTVTRFSLLTVSSETAPNTIRITNCSAKKRKSRTDWLFHSSASSILPLTIREKACDSPHEGHGSPVIFS